MNHSHLLILPLFLCGAATGQSLPMPASFNLMTTEGNRLSDVPLLRTNARVQSFYSETETGMPAFVLSSLRFRYDGPVLSILPYGDEDEAADIANSTIYGLAGAVFAADTDRAVEFAKRMRTGQVDVNGGAFNPVAPFGGYKQSGNGRELGRYGLEEFTELKSIQR